MPTYKLHRPPLWHLEAAARWLSELDGAEVAGLDVQAYAARLALPAEWRTRDRLTEPELPALADLQTWAAIGASDALARRPNRINPNDQRPHALAYAAAYVAVFGAYVMTTASDDVSTTLHIPEGGIPPALAAAWVRAAKNAPLLLRDATNESTGHYTSADGVADQARKTLADQDLMWTIVGDRIGPPTLATSDIGARAYVGDVSLDWMLIHSSGAVLRGTSMAAVVAMKKTPHDKAVQAAKTFLSGNVLRGLLCFVREDKHSTDKRLDREANEGQQVELCKPETAHAVSSLCDQISVLAGEKVSKYDVFKGAWDQTGLPYDANVKEPRDMTPGQAMAVHKWLENDYRQNYSTDDQTWPGHPSEVSDPRGYAPSEGRT